jgi:hypothetical protein
MRKKKELSSEEVQKFLKLSPSDITLTFLKKIFANGELNGVSWKATNSPEDTFTLKKNLLSNDSDIRTTVGSYIMNLFLFEKFRNKVGYFNDAMNAKNIAAMTEVVSELYLEDEITSEVYKDFNERLCWLGFSISSFVTPALGIESLICPPKTKKLMKDLFSKHKKEIEAGNMQVVIDIEKQCLDSARTELKATNASVLDFFDSGAGGTFANSFKNSVLMRGLIEDPLRPGKFYVNLDNLVDGNSPENQHTGANSLIAGSGGRSLLTAVGGYIAKQLNAAFQGIVLGLKGSDCKTKRYLEVELTKENSGKFRYRFIIEPNGKLVRLEKKNMKDYIGKKIKIRSPLYCEDVDLCNKCYGDLSFMLGIKNVGLTFSWIGEKLKLLKMKGFHDSTIKLTKMDFDKSFIEL